MKDESDAEVKSKVKTRESVESKEKVKPGKGIGSAIIGKVIY